MHRPWFLAAILPVWLVACAENEVAPADAGRADAGELAALDESCTPTFELDLQDQGPGGQAWR